MGNPSPPPTDKRPTIPLFPSMSYFYFLILCQSAQEKNSPERRGNPPFPIYVLFLCFLIFQHATNFGVLNGRRSPFSHLCLIFTFCFYVKVQFTYLSYNIRQGGGIHHRAVSPVIIPAPPPPPFILFF